ncbi:MAG: energy transducer TonB, partial [Actinomycetota bacterium]
QYPDKARAKGIEGQVALRAVIQKDGTVGEIEVLKAPEGQFGFKEAAIEAVQTWRYEPALLDGEPLDVYFTVIVDFTLAEKKEKKSGKAED